MKIKIKRLHPDAKLPTYAHPGDVGMDVYSLKEYILQPGERQVLDLGFALEFETGYAAIMTDKGGPPVKYGQHVMGGVYDAGYRGEYNAIIVNLGQEPRKIEKGEKIAQLIIYPVVIADLEESTELSETSRGAGRFGSTGTK